MRSNHMSDIWFDQNYVCYAYLLMHIIILRYLNTYASIISPLAFPPSKEWKYINECLVLLHGATCFVPVQIFCVGTKIYLHIVQVRNILCQTKRSFASSKVGFCASTKVFEEALNAVKFLGWLKKFGMVQNILRPVKPGKSYFSLYLQLFQCWSRKLDFLFFFSKPWIHSDPWKSV